MKPKSSDGPNESDEYLIWNMISKAKNSNIQGLEIPENIEALVKSL